MGAPVTSVLAFDRNGTNRTDSFSGTDFRLGPSAMWVRLPSPGLGADLDRFPGVVQPWGAGRVEVADGLDGHGVEGGGGGDVDLLDDLGAEAAGEPRCPPRA